MTVVQSHERKVVRPENLWPEAVLDAHAALSKADEAAAKQISRG